MSLRLSAWLPSYQRELRAALTCAAEQRYHLVHASTATPDLDPGALGASARRHLRKYLSGIGLSLDALAVDLPGAGLADPARAEERLHLFRETLALCADLGVRRAGVTVGGVTSAQGGELARELLGEVASQSDRFDITTSVLDPDADPTRLAEQIGRLGCRTLRSAVDTARLAGAVPTSLAGVGVVYLRDVRRQGAQLEEVPYGHGAVDLRAVLAWPEVTAQEAALVVRHDGPAGVDALRQGRDYMQTLCSRPVAR